MRFEGRTARRDNNFLVRRSNAFCALELIILGFEGRMLYLILKSGIGMPDYQARPVRDLSDF